MNMRRVVVTGMGIVSPVGNDIESAWTNIREGRSGIRPIEEFDASSFATRIAGTILDFDVTKYIAARDARRMDIFMHYGIASCVDAMTTTTDFSVPAPGRSRRFSFPGASST